MTRNDRDVQQLWPAGTGLAEDTGQDCNTSLLLSSGTNSSFNPQKSAQSVTQHAAAQTLELDAAGSDDAGQENSLLARTGLLSLYRFIWSSGVVCVLAASFIFAIAALLVKLTAGRVPVLEITIIRSSVSLVVSLGLIKLRDIKPVWGQRQNIKWLIPRGVFGAIAMTTFYATILLLPLADGMTLFFLNPCLTAVAAWAIKGEPLGLLGAAGCLISLLGMVVLIHPPMLFGGHANWGMQRVWGTACGVISAVCCAAAFISIRFVGKSEPAIVVAVYFHICTMVMSVLPLAFGWPQAPVLLSWYDFWLLMGVSAGSFMGQLFLTRGMQLENASLMSSLNFFQVLYSYVFGIAFFHEHLSLFGVLGSVLVALGMCCVTLRPKDAAPSDSADAARDVAGAGMGSRLLFGAKSSNHINSNSGRDGSFNERVRRFDSFKRLLLQARSDQEVQDDQEHAAELATISNPNPSVINSTSNNSTASMQNKSMAATRHQMLAGAAQASHMSHVQSLPHEDGAAAPSAVAVEGPYEDSEQQHLLGARHQDLV